MIKKINTKFTKQQVLNTTISVLAELAEVDEILTHQYVTDEDIKFWLEYGDDIDFISVISKAFTYMTLGDLQHVLKSFEQREMYEECQILKECILDEERYLKIENYIKS
jgi:hypothetical protein